MKKLLVLLFTLFLSIPSFANFRIIGEEAMKAIATVDTARKATIDNIVEQLKTRIAGAIEDGSFETGLIFTADLDQNVREVIQSTFLKAGYKVVWDFNEQSKELRLTISWR